MAEEKQSPVMEAVDSFAEKLEKLIKSEKQPVAVLILGSEADKEDPDGSHIIGYAYGREDEMVAALQSFALNNETKHIFRRAIIELAERIHNQQSKDIN